MLLRLDRAIRRLDPAWLVWPAVGAQLLLAVGLALTVLLPRDARISVEAETGIVSFDIAPGQPWMTWGDLSPVRAILPDTECIDSTVALDRVLRGPLRVELRSSEQNGIVASLQRPDAGGISGGLGTVSCPDGKDYPIENSLILIWNEDAARRLNLPMVGAMTVGDDVRTGMSDQLVLTGGRVLVEASSAPFRSGQVSRETPLFAGDRLSLAGETDDKAVPAHALVRLGEDGRLAVTAHANAARALVVHNGQDEASAASLAPTFLEKLQAQSQWALLLLIGAILINVLKLVLEYVLDRDEGRTLDRPRKRSRWARYDR